MTKSKKQPPKQKKRPWLPLAIAGVGLLLIGGLTLLYNPTEANDPTGATAITINAEPLSAEQLAQGERLYNIHCASCHGLEGEGQANWRQPDENGVLPAPPHDSTGHTWHHPDPLLLQIMAEGGSLPDSAMPAYAGTLSNEEMAAILGYIKTFWGPQELEFQNEITSQTLQ